MLISNINHLIIIICSKIYIPNIYYLNNYYNLIILNYNNYVNYNLMHVFKFVLSFVYNYHYSQLFFRCLLKLIFPQLLKYHILYPH